MPSACRIRWRSSSSATSSDALRPSGETRLRGGRSASVMHRARSEDKSTIFCDQSSFLSSARRSAGETVAIVLGETEAFADLAETQKKEFSLPVQDVLLQARLRRKSGGGGDDGEHGHGQWPDDPGIKKHARITSGSGGGLCPLTS